MSNQDLYKQAIAEAKSVRETAIANAKLALEESLTPHLKELLAQKLQEMEEEELEEEVNEMEDTMEEEEIVAEAEESDEDEAEDSEEAEDDSEESEDEAEESTEDQEIEDMTVEDLKDLIRDILAQEMGAEDEMDMGMETPEAGEDMDGMDMVSADDEEINIDEILSELAEEEETMEEEAMDETIADYTGPDAMELAMFLAEKGIENADRIAQAIMGGAGILGIGGLAKLADVITRFQEKKTGKKSQKEGTSEELNEAHKTIQSLRKDLNEVNLLNAKLLYVNKVFKANNLTEAQKANVIAAFDKAETVKEAKLVYESISSSVVAESKKPKRAVREHKSFASKAVGVAPKKEVISEANDVVKRMQKLAGIIK